MILRVCVLTFCSVTSSVKVTLPTSVRMNIHEQRLLGSFALLSPPDEMKGSVKTIIHHFLFPDPGTTMVGPAAQLVRLSERLVDGSG